MSFGEVLDEDGDSVSVQFDFGRATSFIRVIEHNTIVISENSSVEGVYPLEVVLTDDSEQKENSTYRIAFIIIKPTPEAQG